MKFESLRSDPTELDSRHGHSDIHSPLSLVQLQPRFETGGTNAHTDNTKPTQTQTTTNVDNTNVAVNNNKVDTNVNNSIKNTNDNSNANSNVNKNSSQSDSLSLSSSNSASKSTSDSSSNSYSGSDSHSSSNATGGSVGPIDNASSAQGGNAKGGDARAVGQGGAINQNIRTYIPAAIIPANLPSGGECTVGSTWGGNALVGGFTKGNSKIDKGCMVQQDQHFQENLNFQKESRDANLTLQREALQMNMDAQAKQAQHDQAIANASIAAQSRQFQLDQTRAVCDAAVQQAQAAGQSYHSVDQFSRGNTSVTKSLVESTGALAVQQAGNALKLANVCAEAYSTQFGVDQSSVPSLPSIKVDDKPHRK